MAWPGRTFRFSFPALALLGGLWLASPRAAEAAGCHETERPTLGLVFSWDQPVNDGDLLPGLSPALPPAVERSPCPGETPGRTPRLSAPVPGPDVSTGGLALLPATGAGSDRPGSDRAPGREALGRLDRPPRPRAASV